MRNGRLENLALIGLAALALGSSDGCAPAARPSEAPAVPDRKTWTAPDPATIPAGPFGESVRRGLRIFEQTPRYAASYVGNRLSCSDCHIQGGTAAYASPMVGLPGLFPMYNQRAKHVISLAERVQECFLRSENGRRLPYDGPEMTALVSYMQWLSQGQAAGHPFPGRGLVKLPKLEANAGRGSGIFTQQCAGCHGADGAGKPPILPALWGPDAYNTGAGMNRVAKMAAFVRHNMPQNHPGTLTPQEAYDVSAYVASKPHSPFQPGARVSAGSK